MKMKDVYIALSKALLFVLMVGSWLALADGIGLLLAWANDPSGEFGLRGVGLVHGGAAIIVSAVLFWFASAVRRTVAADCGDGV